MKLQCVLLLALIFISNTLASINGPFLFWGVDDLRKFKLNSALESLDDQLLRDLFTESTAIFLFLRNTTSKLNDRNYPTFKKIVDKNQWAYIPQNSLLSNPVDYNVNAEIINLMGSTIQQDAEITSIYNEALLNYGKGRVLGILATHNDDRTIRKREAQTEATNVVSSSTTPEPTTTVPPTFAPDDNSTYTDCTDCVYKVKGKAVLHTTEPPEIIVRREVLNVTGRTDIVTHTIVLNRYNAATYYDYRDNYHRFTIKFPLENNNKSELLSLRFRLPLDPSGYWSINEVEIERNNMDLLNGLDHNLVVDGEIPTAPYGFSYYCSRPLNFSNENNTIILKLQNIQVQARMRLESPKLYAFGDVYDCMGYMTAPIWSGILVTFIMILGASIGICAILDIKPPNRFDNNRSKQLTFTVQD